MRHVRNDVDLLPIVNLTGNLLVHARRPRQLTADSFPRIDVVFASPQGIMRVTTDKSPFLPSILAEGVVIDRRRQTKQTLAD